MKRNRPTPLDELAADLIGDGGSPNLFFVSDEGQGVVAVLLDKDFAIEYAQSIDAYVVEDRKSGEVWGSDRYHEEGRSP